ncbi:hypothetical protein LWC34_23785 [Kibdelosporangium philippinense]|uniref:Uncharacterized protein n=1 Tax=Kibdelosporangium philippinense TaxID=211113 RepID=A0ABS8ZDA6_9PSEU|nr:hypothetical protein [Kibdelosporangium philippinense]MCE7005826.1 hypothetical protein [Kibdelosporangium philippinense]
MRIVAWVFQSIFFLGGLGLGIFAAIRGGQLAANPVTCFETGVPMRAYPCPNADTVPNDLSYMIVVAVLAVACFVAAAVFRPVFPPKYAPSGQNVPQPGWQSPPPQPSGQIPVPPQAQFGPR